jgi:hypothetical protein
MRRKEFEERVLSLNGKGAVLTYKCRAFDKEMGIIRSHVEGGVFYWQLEKGFDIGDNGLEVTHRINPPNEVIKEIREISLEVLVMTYIIFLDVSRKITQLG